MVNRYCGEPLLWRIVIIPDYILYFFTEDSSDIVVDRHQRSARESLKKLCSLSYNIRDIQVLTNIEHSVNKIIAEIERSEKSSSPPRFVPLRKRLSLKKYVNRSGLKASVLKKHSKLDISKGLTLNNFYCFMHPSKKVDFWECILDSACLSVLDL